MYPSCKVTEQVTGAYEGEPGPGNQFIRQPYLGQRLARPLGLMDHSIVDLGVLNAQLFQLEGGFFLHLD